ncbi:MAG: hypothetical protein HQM16_09060 [Deltaproteobacteria bacterium]|nr:hypothetical protein [Deltaproteobacteria bacterium]
MSFTEVKLGAAFMQNYGHLFNRLKGVQKEVIEESLADGVINNDDFDRYLDCDDKLKKGSTTQCLMKSGSQEFYKYQFLRLIYTSFSFFGAKRGSRHNPTSEALEDFASWFAKSAETFFLSNDVVCDDFEKKEFPLRQETCGDPSIEKFLDSLPEVELIDSHRVISGDRVLLVTHQTPHFDKHDAAKDAVERYMQEAKDDGFVTAELVIGSDGFSAYNQEGILADYHVNSVYGDHNLVINATEVVVAGGVWGLCHLKTIRHLLDNRDPKNDLVIRIPMDAVYMYDFAQGSNRVTTVNLKTYLRPYRGSINFVRMIEMFDRLNVPQYNIIYYYNGEYVSGNISDPTKATVTISYE